MVPSSIKSLVFLAVAGLVNLVAAAPVSAQGTVRRHLVYFRDKAGSPYSVAQPQEFLSARSVARRNRQGIAVLPRDLPVNPAYVAQVRGVAGTQIHYTSRWFNAAVVSCDSATLVRVMALAPVRSAATLNRSFRDVSPTAAPTQVPPAAARGTLATRAQYGPAYRQNEQIGALAMHDAGFRGEGMQIAVFDAGFPGVDQISALQPLFQEQRLAGTRNFVDGGTSVFLRSGHGTNCLSAMAANESGKYIGSAPKATYHLCITEDVSSEHPIEEANWLAAAEYADSVGVDIISSSLGYTTFDSPSVSYTYADMNGRTAISSRAATIAAHVGILVVNAAGNEGSSSWRYISAPADADSIMSVGAVDSLGNHASFSSFGPTSDGRIKPTLMAMGRAAAVLSPNGAAYRGNGTSFACPILAGMAAGFWQANPTLTAQQVITALRNTASQANTPSPALGYGIPNFVTAYNALNPNAPLSSKNNKDLDGDALSLFPNPTGDGAVTLALPSVLRGKPLRVRVLDARGAVVATQQVAATASSTAGLQLGRLAKGNYTCEVSTRDARRTVKFTQQ
ncbi:S8 family serine peptidase [Hymenobacter arizonensis]|uniref:Por secretion system C-terminal sorting domain-containing protein n=1 Tax=Hymenobacter arizonensis TaxID=1227077 RepID=A0A1I5TYI5_HYMAR|nr:S8 family serine peptidase [Hymenobacter arizonensis]SFP88098.1 Por secretion system C-terminal sorting domain-containing protein [Hymenobacter arizonensis]